RRSTGGRITACRSASPCRPSTRCSSTAPAWRRPAPARPRLRSRRRRSPTRSSTPPVHACVKRRSRPRASKPPWLLARNELFPADRHLLERVPVLSGPFEKHDLCPIHRPRGEQHVLGGVDLLRRVQEIIHHGQLARAVGKRHRVQRFG